MTQKNGGHIALRSIEMLYFCSISTSTSSFRRSNLFTARGPWSIANRTLQISHSPINFRFVVFVDMEGKVRRDSVVVVVCPLDNLMSSHSHSLMIKGISTSSGNFIGGTTCVTQTMHNMMLNTSY